MRLVALKGHRLVGKCAANPDISKKSTQSQKEVSNALMSIISNIDKCQSRQSLIFNSYYNAVIFL
jgi:hypothetical protein